MKKTLNDFSLEGLNYLLAYPSEASDECIKDLVKFILDLKTAKPICWVYENDLPDLRKGHNIRLNARTLTRPQGRITGCPYKQPNMIPLWTF